MKNLNFTLEVMNGAVSILVFFLLIWLVFHLHDRRRSVATWWTLFVGIPGGLSLALYLYIEQAGTLFTRVVVWVWRMKGGAVPFTTIQNSFMILGACMTGTGILLMIRLLSRPRFGDWPWISSLVVSGAYVIIRSVMHFA